MKTLTANEWVKLNNHKTIEELMIEYARYHIDMANESLERRVEVFPCGNSYTVSIIHYPKTDIK